LRDVVCTDGKFTKMPWAVSGPEVGDGGVVLHRAHIGLEHQVELAGLGEALLGAAVGTGAGVGQLIGPEPLLAVAAVDERVGEGGDVTRCFPHLRRHQDGGVETDDVVAALDHGPPPRLFDVALEEDAEGPVVPGGPEAPVDLARREHETPALGQVDDGVHQIRSGGHTPEC
jgi:hypothetical protein